MQLNYQILSGNQADIFAKINITKLVLALAEENCEVLSLEEHDETLESYYVNLIGGDPHE
jgi:ABC-2 type transport system ATP-binding protein